MKKKSLLTMIVALVLVGAVGIGATLAYLSSTTGVMKNTFSVGSVKVKQDEAKWDDDNDKKTNERTESGNSYTDIQPGDKLDKDPTATVIAGSADCYVFMQLSGADELVGAATATDAEGNTVSAFSFDDFNADAWVKVADEDNKEETTLDGVYRYKNSATNDIVKKSDGDQELPALFTSVTYSIYAEELAAGVTLSNVTIKTCAVQADHMTVDEALNAAVTEMKDAE